MRRALRALHLTRRAAEWTAVLTGRMVDAFRRLPPRIALFYVSALALAIARRDRWTLASATRPDDLETLLAVAGNAREVAEIGTGPGWSAIALAVAHPERRIVSFDVLPRPAAGYARLVPRSARERIRFEVMPGAVGAEHAPEVDFVFIDSSHEFEETVDTFRAWEPRLRPGGVAAFHDYGNPQHPGVEAAVRRLGLDGRDQHGVYVWTKPG